MKNSDFELIRRTLDGDQSAFTALVTKYQKWVHTLVWRKIGDFHIAEELTQDIFLKAYKKLSTLKPPYNFPGWLYVIATRHCISWIRKKRQPTTSLNEMSTLEIEERCYQQYEAARSEASAIEHQRSIVKQLLQKLPESERTVVTLHYLAEMSCENIGEFLGVSTNTIKSRLRRARKRLEKQEHLLHDVPSLFRLPQDLTVKVMREIARIKPAAPAVSKPWLPWGLSFASTCLVILMIGFGPQALSRFQQPYDLDATSEMTVELVDAPVMFESKRELDVRNQFGKRNAPGKDGSGTVSRADAGLLTVAQADTVEIGKTEPQWMPTKGPDGGGVGNLFATSEKEVYAIGGTRLYQLAADNTGWTLINAALPATSYKMPMAEGEDTLYIVNDTELLASTDRGVTLHFLGPRPRGRAIALLIPSKLRWSQDAQIEMYLVLTGGVFRSTDTGKTWNAFNDGLTAPDIHTAVTVENIPFLATKQGLYRLNAGVWEKLPVAQAQSIDSLAVANGTIYISAPKQINQKSGSLFASSDFGTSWVDITPTNLKIEMSPLTIGSVKLVAAGETLLVLGGTVLRSRDAGNTWEHLGFHKHIVGAGFFPGIALDENTFFLSRAGELRRSTDGGRSWHLFTTGIAAPHILDLAQRNNVLYAATNKGIAKSIDSGNQWTQLDTNLPLPPNKSIGALKLSNMTVVGDTLYLRANQGGSTNCLLYSHPNTDTVRHIEGMPVYVDPNHGKWLESAIRSTATVGLSKANQPDLFRYQLGIEEAATRTTGEFAVTGNTFYIEYERKLYRCSRGDPEWSDTGMQDAPVFDGFYATRGFHVAASGKVVYLGKSDGSLFQSLDSGNTWKNITTSFPLSLDSTVSHTDLLEKLPYFKEIILARNTVYVSTTDGVAMSDDGKNWHVLTDIGQTPLAMQHLAFDDTTLYGVSQIGVYRLEHKVGIWEQITSEVLGQVTSLVVSGDVLYVGTEHRGILSLPLPGSQ